MYLIPECYIGVLFIFFVDCVIDLIDWHHLSVVEQVILKVFNRGGTEWPTKVQANISLFLDIFMFFIVFWLAEALHEGSKSFPFPICFR